MSLSETHLRGAELAGIEPGYWDIWGNYHQTRPEVCEAILKSLSLGTEADIEARLWEQWSRLLPPVVVTGAQGAEIPLNLIDGAGERSVRFQLRLEDETKESWTVDPATLPVAGQLELRGRRFERRLTQLAAQLPLGYHELRAECGDESAVTRLIVCPERAYLPPQLAEGGKAAGVAVSLYGLRSRRNWGCGDLTDLLRLTDWVGDDLGAAFIALNPLHAIHNRQPFNTSPYLPNSIFYRNPIYLDIERLEDFRVSRAAQRLYATPEVQAEIAALRSSPFVEYERVFALKLRFLRLCFETFQRRCRRRSPCASAFEQYCLQEGELLDLYATYCALDEHLHASNPEIWTWPQWPEAYQDPTSSAVRQFARDHERDILFHKYVQWQLDEQIGQTQAYARSKGLFIGLYHDLALATDRCGSDLWAHRDHFVSGCRVGAPPDGFAPDGQDWGFPPPNSLRHRETGYRLFVESIRHNCRHGGALRIDHVMRFFRLFWIPDGMPAASGAYVREPAEELLRILALESVRNQFVVVGEDLGTVEPDFRRTLERFGVLSYRLLYFERHPDGRFRLPEEYPRQALVSSTTHDLATLAGFWIGRDIEARREAGLIGEQQARSQWQERNLDKQRMLDALFAAGLLPDWFPRSAAEIPELTGELHNAVIGFLAKTPSMLLLVNQEDLTKETEQQNLPGSTWQYPNWRRKMQFTVEELRYSGLAHDFAAMFRHWLERTGRSSRTAAGQAGLTSESG
jgi:4-alpha-glucanotransferase